MVVAITVTSDFQVGALQVAKELTGPGAEHFGDRAFRFRVACEINGAPDAYVAAVTLQRPTVSATVDDVPPARRAS